MSQPEPAPTPLALLLAALEQLAAGFKEAGHTMSVQGAMGWVYRGRVNDARSVLDRMPLAAVKQAAVAAAALAALCDEVVAGKVGA